MQTNWAERMLTSCQAPALGWPTESPIASILREQVKALQVYVRTDMSLVT